MGTVGSGFKLKEFSSSDPGAIGWRVSVGEIFD